MASLNRAPGLLLALVLIAAGISSEVRAEEPLELGDDGWYSWSVASSGEYSEERFYVSVKSGQTKKIDILGHWCHGWSRSTQNRHPDAIDLGFVDTDISIDWFQQFIGARSNLGSDALAAISMHEGDRAVQIMIDLVESDAHMDVREEAVFWMAQSGSPAAFAYLDRLLMLN